MKKEGVIAELTLNYNSLDTENKVLNLEIENQKRNLNEMQVNGINIL